jgi:5'-nucleotidase
LRILVSNDDGYFAPGLEALCRVAARFGEVFVVAPETEQSYMGHRVSAGTHDLVATPYGENRFHVNGTPADCIRIALRVLGLEPDLVLSGINKGGNLGVDIYTSGTVAAAREAAIWGIRSVALSQYVKREMLLDWGHAAALASEAIGFLLKEDPAPGAYWNVNLPHLATPEAPICMCETDPSPQDVHYTPSGAGHRYCGTYAKRPAKPGCDVEHCFAGRIAISRLQL